MKYVRVMEWIDTKWHLTKDMIGEFPSVEAYDLACITKLWRNVEIVCDTDGRYLLVWPGSTTEQIRDAHRFATIEAAAAAALTMLGAEG